ncbi:MAG: Rrf2 family transcriptional regulator [Candidatus Omnitrophota bacterium]|nr:Rrf2 family transcriptional regulator [Candidatus Omnitrophota bacterium]
MKLLTRNTDYGIRALCFIAKEKDRVVAAPELVKALKIPRAFLRKILQALTKNCFVKSYKGIGGGFKLALSPGKIYIVEVAKVFQGDFRLNECFLNKKICPDRRTCPLKRKIDKIEKDVVSELGVITIGELIKA